MIIYVKFKGVKYKLLELFNWSATSLNAIYFKIGISTKTSSPRRIITLEMYIELQSWSLTWASTINDIDNIIS